MNEKKDDVEFAQIAFALNADNARVAFTRMVTAYVSRIATLKLTTSEDEVEHSMTMGQWMLIELAQSLWGLSFADAATVVRRSIRAARAAVQEAI